MIMKTRFLWTLIAFGLLAATSCSKGTTAQSTPQAAPSQPSAPAAVQPVTQPAAQPASLSSQPVPAAPAASGIASAQYSANPDLRCDLLEVKRVSGGGVLVKWRIVNSAAKDVYYDGQWADLYYIDPGENKKYPFLTDAGGARIAEVFWGAVPFGQQRASWAKFPAPPATSNKIAVHIPAFPPFEDVPLAQ